MRGGQLAPEIRSRPIDDSLKPREQGSPVNRLTGFCAAERIGPLCEPFLVR
jgi:hypothetical protein